MLKYIAWIQELGEALGMHQGGCNGRLSLCVFGRDNSRFDIWVMKEYGVKESWTKHMVVENLYSSGLMCRDHYEPVKFLENGEILMSFNRFEVLCYNPLTKSFQSTHLTHHSLVSIAHTPSFISLYHVAKGELVQRVQGSKENAKSSAEATADYTSFGTSPNEPPTIN